MSKCRWKLFLMLGVTLVLAFVLMQFPFPPAAGIDASKELVLVQAHQVNLQFGSEIVFTYGPWGFLLSQFSFHGTSWLKILWETVGKFGLAATLVLLGMRFSLPRQLLFYAALIFAAVAFSETILLICVTLVSLIWLLTRESKAWELGLALAWLSFLSQVKFSYCVLSAIAVSLALCQCARTGMWKRGFAIAAAYAGGFSLFWVAAGQSFANVPIYLYRSWQVSDGYWNAVVLNTVSMTVWWTALAIGCCVVVFAAAAARKTVEWRWTGFGLAYFCLAWFLTWKHGFTRADPPHVVTFFLHGLVFALAAPIYFKGTRSFSLLDLVPVLSIVGLHLADQKALPRLPGNLWSHLSNTPRKMLDFRNREKRMADAEAQDSALYFDLQRVVRDQTIDVITWEQSEVIRAGLTYQPRPVFQSYLTFSRALAEINLHFYQGERAPRFVLARIQAIDSRLPALEDSLLLEELPRRYSIAAERADYLLLERKMEQPAERDQTRDCGARRRVRLGEEILLPRDRNVALELRASFKPTFYGRIRAFFAQPASLSIVLTDDRGQKISCRLIPSMAETGFIVQPFFATQPEFAALFDGRPSHSIRSISFAADVTGCWSGARVQFCWLNELSLGTPVVGKDTAPR
jgi:hypothetical protein